MASAFDEPMALNTGFRLGASDVVVEAEEVESFMG